MDFFIACIFKNYVYSTFIPTQIIAIKRKKIKLESCTIQNDTYLKTDSTA